MSAPLWRFDGYLWCPQCLTIQLFGDDEGDHLPLQAWVAYMADQMERGWAPEAELPEPLALSTLEGGERCIECGHDPC